MEPAYEDKVCVPAAPSVPSVIYRLRCNFRIAQNDWGRQAAHQVVTPQDICTSKAHLPETSEAAPHCTHPHLPLSLQGIPLEEEHVVLGLLALLLPSSDAAYLKKHEYELSSCSRSVQSLSYSLGEASDIVSRASGVQNTDCREVSNAR